MGRSPHPGWEHWRPVAGDGRWRNAQTEPPPDPPAAVEWLERRTGAADHEYRRRTEMGALADYTAPALPNE